MTKGEWVLAFAIGGMVAVLLMWASWTFAGMPYVTVQDCIEYGRSIK